MVRFVTVLVAATFMLRCTRAVPQVLLRRDGMIGTDKTEAFTSQKINWAKHVQRTDSHYCKHVKLFGNKKDHIPARKIIQAMMENNAMSRIFVVGTHDGSDIKDMFMEKWYQPKKAQIYGWEILKSNLAAARRRLQEHEEVEPIHAGVSDSNGTVMAISGGDQTAGLYPSGAHGFNSAGESVTTQRWDLFVESRIISQVAYALIDVEGHEMSVINGMNLERLRTTFPIFQIELGGTWVDERHTGHVTQEGAVRYLGGDGSLLQNTSHDGLASQQRMEISARASAMRKLAGLGYRLYLMGSSKEDMPMLAPAGPDLFKNVTCVAQNGKFNVNSNLLAVLETFVEGKPWLMKVVDDMVAKDASFD